MKKSKIVMNSCISEIIDKYKFSKIYVYGSDNLELEKLIYNLTSSSIIGGDVDFCNVLFGKYFSGNADLVLNEDIYKDLKLNVDSEFNNLEKLAFAIIYKAYKSEYNNEHNKRNFDNVVKNKESLVKKVKNQIGDISLQLYRFEKCLIEEFIEDITEDDLLIIDNRTHNFIENRLIEILNNLCIKFIIISKKEISYLYQNLILKSNYLNIYSNLKLKTKILSIKTDKKIFKKSFDIFENGKIENIEIKQLYLSQFNDLRQKYISRQIHYLGTPKICYGLFADDKLFGMFGLSNDYRNKPPKDIEQPSIYLLSDFVVDSNIKKLSKLVLYCVLSKEVKLLAERFLNKEIKTIYTNVFTKNMTSIKYRDLFVLQGRKQFQNGDYNLTYYSQMGKWNLKEGLKLWKQKL